MLKYVVFFRSLWYVVVAWFEFDDRDAARMLVAEALGASIMFIVTHDCMTRCNQSFA